MPANPFTGKYNNKSFAYGRLVECTTTVIERVNELNSGSEAQHKTKMTQNGQ